MQEQLKAIKNTLGGIHRVHALTDQYMKEIRELGDRMNAKAQATYQAFINDEIEYEEYDRRMTAIDREQHSEGGRIEKAYVAACRGNAGQ